MSNVIKKAGRISPTPMGDYDNTTTYRRLDWVKYGGTSYICKKNNTMGIAPSNPERWQKIVDEVGDMNIIFTEPTEKILFNSGESLSVIIGKIKKFLSDIKTVAFTGKYSDLSGTPGVVSKTANGFAPQLPNETTTTKYLRQDGTWQVPPDTNTQTLTGVKGNAESAYRTGNVNLTPANIGAVATSKVLTTKEQINANTDTSNVAGATAVKAMVAEINSKLISNIITPISTDNVWIKSANVYCYKILDRYIIQFSEVEFTKEDDFGYHSVLLWNFNLPGTTWTTFVITSSWGSNDVLRLLNDGGKIYGHYDSPTIDATYYGTIII